LVQSVTQRRNKQTCQPQWGYSHICFCACMYIHELSTLAALHAAKGLRDGQQPCLFSTAPTSEPCTLSDSPQAELHRPKSASTQSRVAVMQIGCRCKATISCWRWQRCSTSSTTDSCCYRVYQQLRKVRPIRSSFLPVTQPAPRRSCATAPRSGDSQLCISS